MRLGAGYKRRENVRRIFLRQAKYAGGRLQVEYRFWTSQDGDDLREGGETTGALDRRVGLEQEFFLVDDSGLLSDRADEFLDLCESMPEREGPDLACVAPEFVKGLVEIYTPPVEDLADLEREYLRNLKLALRSARSLGLRLYPLGTYPLPFDPAMREKPDYEVQVRTVGRERFAHAGRCAGTHLHLELPAGTVSADVGISAAAPAAARSEALNLYNLATALDPALVALTRSSPFYEGRAQGFSPRTVHYRGGAAFGWEGVYTDLPQVGALLPYAESVEDLVRQQFDRYEAWLAAMDRAGVERSLFVEAGGDLLRPAWNPVRLNRQGTVELRGMDSNYPEVTLAAAALISGSADRVRREGLEVRPDEGTRAFELDGGTLRVPDFAYLGTELLYAAVAGDPLDPEISRYLDSILDFAEDGTGRLCWLREHRRSTGGYPITESVLLEHRPLKNGHVSREEGLLVVQEACDELVAQVDRLSVRMDR